MDVTFPGSGWGGKRAESGQKPAPGESLEAARRRKETALADLRQIEVEKRRGALLAADAVARHWQDILRRVRAGVLACPSRIRARLPHLSVQDVEVIDRELHDALTALADDAQDAAPDAPHDLSAARHDSDVPGRKIASWPIFEYGFVLGAVA